MLQELEDVCNTLDKVTESDAKHIMSHINSRLKKILNAEIIDVLYKEEERENVTLKPLSSLVASGTRAEAIQWTISENSKGIWPRVFYEKKTAWLENIKELKKAKAPGKSPAVSPEIIEEIKYEDVSQIFSNTESIICLPLVFERESIGVFCVELSRSGSFNPQIYEFLRRLSVSYACLAWKLLAFIVSRKHINMTLEHLRSTISDDAIRDHISVSGDGIMLRPFGDECNDICRCVTGGFEKYGYQLEHFVAMSGRSIIDDLKTALRLSPFGVVDITGLNPNVLLELGMMIILGKEVMILKSGDDEADLPFDIRVEQVDHYELRGNDAHIIDSATGNLVPINDRISAFIHRLINKGLLK